MRDTVSSSLPLSTHLNKNSPYLSYFPEYSLCYLFSNLPRGVLIPLRSILVIDLGRRWAGPPPQTSNSPWPAPFSQMTAAAAPDAVSFTGGETESISFLSIAEDGEETANPTRFKGHAWLRRLVYAYIAFHAVMVSIWENYEQLFPFQKVVIAFGVYWTTCRICKTCYPCSSMLYTDLASLSSPWALFYTRCDRNKVSQRERQINSKISTSKIRENAPTIRGKPKK